jgi:hypothetical protein
MSTQAVSAEQFAKLFHHYHQALGPEFGSDIHATQSLWNDIPQNDRKRMIAAARLALLELGSIESDQEEFRRYFATPGEAEWGC